MKLSIVLASLAAAILVPSAMAFQKETKTQSEIGGLLISPLLQRLVVKPGQTADVVFVTDNPRQTTEGAQFELLPFAVEDWSYKTLYGVDNPRDCADWFETKSQGVDVKPGERKEVRLKFTAPRGTAGAYWCMLKVTPHPDGSTTKSAVAYEIPMVLIAGKNVKPTLRVTTPTLEKVPGAKAGYLATLPVESMGDGFTTIGTIGNLRSMPSGRILNDFHLDDRNLMPGSKRNLSFLVPSLPDGQYRIQFRALEGTHQLQPITSDYMVTKGEPKAMTEGAALEQTPITIEPSSINLAIPRGGNRSVTVKVTNNGVKALPIALSASLLDQSLNGAVGVVDSKQPIGMSVDIDNDPEAIEPGETRSVHITLGVPETASGDIWFALVAKQPGNDKALVESSFCSISVPTTQKPELVLENATVIKDGAKSIAIKYQIRNSGNIALRPEATAAVLEAGVKLLDRVGVAVVGDGGILPGKTVENTIMVPQKLKPGNHILEIDYQYGIKDFAKLRVPITIPVPKAATPAKAAAKK